MGVDLSVLTDWWWQPLMEHVLMPITEPIADAIAEVAGEVVDEMEEFSDCAGDDQGNETIDDDKRSACDIGEKESKDPN